MKYFFVCGESSGDYLSSLIVRALIDTHDAEIQAMGGPLLSTAGADIIQDIAETQVMGWLDVITKLSKFRKILSKVKRAIIDFEPSAVVLVDFGSFNLRLAEWCHKRGIRVAYFIPPKVWASRERRIEKLKEYCDEVIVLFPFEKEYFDTKGLQTSYHGYPLAGIRDTTDLDLGFRNQYSLSDRPIITLLPGSRPQEIRYMLEPMIQAASRLPEYQICISQAKGLSILQLEKYIPNELQSQVIIISGSPHQLILQSKIAIVTSGTATLECALLGTPMVTCYKTSLLNYTIAKQIINVPYISLPNLILSKRVVPELIQASCNSQDIYQALITTLQASQLSSQIDDFGDIYRRLHNINTISSIAKAIIG